MSRAAKRVKQSRIKDGQTDQEQPTSNLQKMILPLKVGASMDFSEYEVRRLDDNFCNFQLQSCGEGGSGAPARMAIQDALKISPVLKVWYDSDLRNGSMAYRADESFSQEMLTQLTLAVYSGQLNITAEQIPDWTRLADFLDIECLREALADGLSQSLQQAKRFPEDVLWIAQQSSLCPLSLKAVERAVVESFLKTEVLVAIFKKIEPQKKTEIIGKLINARSAKEMFTHLQSSRADWCLSEEQALMIIKKRRELIIPVVFASGAWVHTQNYADLKNFAFQAGFPTYWY